MTLFTRTHVHRPGRSEKPQRELDCFPVLQHACRAFNSYLSAGEYEAAYGCMIQVYWSPAAVLQMTTALSATVTHNHWIIRPGFASGDLHDEGKRFIAINGDGKRIVFDTLNDAHVFVSAHMTET